MHPTEERLNALPAPLAEIGALFILHGKGPRGGSWEHWQTIDTRLAAAVGTLDAQPAAERDLFFRAIHPELAPLIASAWELHIRLPYQTNTARRGFRAPRNPACSAHARSLWLSGVVAAAMAFDCDLYTFAREPRKYFHRWAPVAGVILAAALDARTPESDALFDALSAAVNGDESKAQMGRHLTTALLCCSRPEAWALAEKLLLAAQRQEGLRQVILETVDMAHPEAFRRMVALIRAEKLTRFASVARAIGVWFQLPLDSAETKRMDGILDAVLPLLLNPERRNAALASPDTESVYLALWAAAWEDAIAAIELARPILRDASVERRYAAAHLLAQLALPEACDALADSLADPDLRVAIRAASAPPLCIESKTGAASAGMFERIEALLARVPKEADLGTIGWEWNRLTADPAALAMLLLHYRGDRAFSRLAPHVARFGPDGRVALLHRIQAAARTGGAEGARPLVIGLLGDASPAVREAAFRTLYGNVISPEEARELEPLLARKASDLRRGLIVLLLQQPEPERRTSAARLAESRDALMRQAGEEMLEQMRANETTSPTLDDGLGLFDPAQCTPPAAIRTGPSPVLVTDATRRLLESLDQLVEVHRNHVVTWNIEGGPSREELLGNMMFFPGPASKRDLPLRELWENWWRARSAELRDPDGLELLRALAAGTTKENPFTPAWQKPLAEGLIPQVPLKYPKQVHGVLEWMLREPLPAVTPEFLMDALEATFVRIAPAMKENREDSMFGDWRSFGLVGNWVRVAYNCRQLRPELWTAQHWARLWPLLRWMDCGIPGQRRMRPTVEDLMSAHRAGAATEADVYAHLMAEEDRPGFIQNWELRWLTQRNPGPIGEKFPELVPMAARCRDRIIEVELTRGDLPTEASGKAMALSTIYGAALALRLLKALGNEPLSRGWARDNQSKTTVFSHLLRVCLPAESDTPEQFKQQVKTSGIPASRLIDFAIYAPQWAVWVEQASGIKGLGDAAFWLHAHTKDRSWNIDPQIRELWYAAVSERTPLTVENLLDGVVDVNWFHDVYKKVGAKNWAAVLESAKYASGGGGHKRAELFAEALLGKVTQKALAARILEKRHQDSVRALGLVPLAKNARPQILQRYEILQGFLKGTRKFGPQQQASEKLAASIGFENLARTAGYPDAQRLSWAMEAAAIADLKNGPIEVTAANVTVRLEIDAAGDPQISATKSGKPLKEIPAAAKKVPAIAALRERRTALAAQTSRMRVSLEESMVRGDRFTAAEIAELQEHPLLRPRLASVVLVSGSGELTYCGDAVKGEFRIAHPVDFLASGEWSRWQQECFSSARVQPFKQIFRELYVLTEAENRQQNYSSRYEGQQVNPKQALALVGTRGWIGVPGEGVRRTFHREGLSAHVTFLEGFYTPADVDGLTVKHVLFARRGECAPVMLADVPPRVFSEAMRDLDLMVSVAHRGAVDPETTASTVEMRAALVRETARLLKLANVRLNGAHVFVEGARGSYNIHLGSGVVHVQPGGALCIIPVHMQHRGRIFLPFADDDPKTAEVVSKVLLLARDEQIQDPTILEQLPRDVLQSPTCVNG